MNRRRFIKTSSLFLAQQTLKPLPLALLLDSITRGVMNRAVAEQTGKTTKNWVDFCFFGAPPNWHYDLFLQTSQKELESLIPNAMVKTCFKQTTQNKKTVLTPDYQTWNYAGIPAPYVWQFSVPAPGAGKPRPTRPMSDLLKNFLSIRGIYTGINDHGPNMRIHFQTNGATQSLPAYGADVSDTYFSAVRLNSSFAEFLSTKEKISTDINMNYGQGESPIADLASAFQKNPNIASTSSNSKVKTAIDTARQALASEAIARHPKNKLAQEAMNKAMKVISETNWTTINSDWVELLDKYSELVRRSFDFDETPLRGISDQPVPYDPALRQLTHQVYWNQDLIANLAAGTDLRILLKNTTTKETTFLYGLAEGFALAELILKYNLSNSVTVSFSGGNMSGLKTPLGIINTDEHGIGVVPGIILNSHLAVAHSACLLEFISFLDKKGLWNNTLINSGGEMIRSPRNSGNGSDHSSTAYLSLYSGCIEGPIILGNIAKENGPIAVGGQNLKAKPPVNPYLGTWGEAADQTFTMEYAHNTVAKILGLAPPIVAREPLVSLDGKGKVSKKYYVNGKTT
jgi:hypothetical protein